MMYFVHSPIRNFYILNFVFALLKKFYLWTSCSSLPFNVDFFNSSSISYKIINACRFTGASWWNSLHYMLNVPNSKFSKFYQ